ncbi:MAG: spondin domain-containing protein [Gemmatimonadota bacterium]
MRRSLLAAVAAVTLVGCQESVNDVTLDGSAALEAANSVGAQVDPDRFFEVTITNLTSSQALTPPVFATHTRSVSIFETGEPASFEIKEVAENGNVDPLVMALSGNPDVGEVVVPLNDFPPLRPGKVRRFEIQTRGEMGRISFAAMLICTNDGFTGLNGVRLPVAVGDTKVYYSNSFDAGTEINTEDFANMVPPCPLLSGVPSSVPGTGMSDPMLAENGVVHRHGGILGIADLIPAIHGWSDPVAKVEIRRIR